MKLRVIADKFDTSTGAFIDTCYEVDDAKCHISADARSGYVDLFGPNGKLVVSDSPADFQRVRVYGRDGVIQETLSCSNGTVTRAVGMTGDSILSGLQTRL